MQPAALARRPQLQAGGRVARGQRGGGGGGSGEVISPLGRQAGANNRPSERESKRGEARGEAAAGGPNEAQSIDLGPSEPDSLRLRSLPSRSLGLVGSFVAPAATTRSREPASQPDALGQRVARLARVWRRRRHSYLPALSARLAESHSICAAELDASILHIFATLGNVDLRLGGHH